MELTILMPCLNEAETIETCIKKANSFLEKNVIEGEVLISDNGSTDGSAEIANNLGTKVVHAPIRGYGGHLLLVVMRRKENMSLWAMQMTAIILCSCPCFWINSETDMI